MKHWLTSRNRKWNKKYLPVLIFLLVMLGVIGISWGFNIISKSPNLAAGSSGNLLENVAIASNQYSLCPSQPQGEPLANGKLQFYPMKLVVEPWRGEHNVYAIFALPIKYQYRHTNSQVMVVKGTGTQWQVTIANPRLYNLTTPEGYFLVIGFFRTRIALWRFVTGSFDQLQQPCNWVLYL